MSFLQSEKDVARDGRTSKLGKEAEAPLRDQIVKRLYASMTDEERKIPEKIAEAWYTSTTAIAEVLEKQQNFLADLDGFTSDETTQQPFGGASNIHLPAAFIVCKSYHARFLEALLGIDPPFAMKARREDGSDRVQVCEDLMRYALQQWANNFKGIEDVVDPWIWNWCTTGTGILKARWKSEWETFEDVEDRYLPIAPLLQYGAQGEEIYTPQWKHEEVAVKKTLKTFAGPQYDLVQLEDFRMIGGEGDPDRADMLIHRTYMTASELWTKVDQKIFDEDVVEDLIECAGPDDPLLADSSGIKQQRKSNVGVATSTDSTHLDRYEVLEACLKIDTDGSGIVSEVVLTVAARTRKLLSATYLRRLMPSGDRPYSVIHFHKRPGENYGMGLMEILAPLTAELDTMHNIRVDNGLFESQPFYLYRATASMDAEEIVIEPGVGIPCDNPATDIVFPQLPPRTAFTSNEEQVVQGYIERLTGISDLSLGVMTGTQGPTRTAAGVRAILGENNNNLSVHLRRLNRGWTKVLRMTWHMLQNRVEPNFSFRITGDDGKDIFRKISDHDLGMEADFELSANTSNSNKAVQIELMQQVVGMSMNPLNIQMGVTGPSEIYAAQKGYLNALGLKDVHRYIKRPADYYYAMSPQDEVLRVVTGDEIPVDPRADHKGFVAFASAMLQKQNEPSEATLNVEQQSKLIKQMTAHQAMQQALEAQQAQAAQQAQMQQNMVQAPGGAAAAANPSYSNQPKTDPGHMFA